MFFFLVVYTAKMLYVYNIIYHIRVYSELAYLCERAHNILFAQRF